MIHKTYKLILKRSLVFLGGIILLFISCSTASYMKPANDLYKRGFLNIEESEYFVALESKAEIENCIAKNEEVKSSLSNAFLNDSNEKLDFVNVNLIRAVTIRGQVTKAIPLRFLSEHFYFKFFLCINNPGDVVLSNLVKSNQQLTRAETTKLLSCILDYKYTSDSNKNCLDCGYLTVKSE